MDVSTDTIEEKVLTQKALRAILDKGPSITFVWELSEGWPVRFVTRNVEQFGYSVEEFLNGSLQYDDILYAPDRQKIGDEVSTALSRGDTNLEQKYRIVTRSGETRWIKDWTEFIRDENGVVQYAQGIILDITEFSKAEELARSYAMFPQENPNPVLRVDCFGDITLTNTAATRIIEDLSSLNPDQQLSWKRMINMASDLQNTGRVDLEVGSKTYEFNICHVEGKDYTNLYGDDVTELRKNESRMADIAENIPGAIFQYTLSHDGSEQIEFISKGCEELWEVSARDVGENLNTLWGMIEEDDIYEMRRTIKESEENLTLWKHQYRIKTPSGNQKWLNSIGRPHRTNKGDTVWNTIVFDMTAEKNTAKALSEALAQAVHVLSAALEARDPYTAGHEKRVTEISLQIGRKLGLSVHRLKGLELAATIHDVGKIQIPAEILSKPTRLTKQEFELIKVHPTVGASLLSDVTFEWPIADIIRQHHERFDGSGYPDGLAGENIILEARIIAVADTIEAMASHRPYRPGLGIEKAAIEIRDGSGTRYDPVVAKACLELVESGEIKIEGGA
ncbi:MAG: PAS domain-containing protein [Gimesia sp.]|nr:PAS domain-containing protein [Gimesia sp.]